MRIFTFLQRIIILLLSVSALSGCVFFKSSHNASVKKVFEITNIKFYGTLWNKEYNKYNIISQDGGSSFKVPGGSIWCYGDTFKGTRDKSGIPHFKGGAVSCTIAFLPNNAKPYPPKFQYLAGKGGIAVSPFSFIGKENSKVNSIWPLAGIYLSGKSYLYYAMIEKIGTGCWDFRHIGSGLAASDKPLGHYTRIIKNNTWKFPVNPSSIIKTKEWLYLYSIENTGANTQGIFLSRVKPENLEDPSSYEYYSGNNKFTKNINEKKVMLNKIYGQASVVWNSYLQKYLLASSSNFWEHLLIKFYAADTPVGPWFNTNTKVTVPGIRQNKKTDLVYCTFFHPSLFRKNGKIMYLTYSLMLRNSVFDANCEMVKVEIEK
jgi:hypothetical protein